MTVQKILDHPVVVKRVSDAVRTDRARVKGIIRRYMHKAKELPRGEVKSTLLELLRELDREVQEG